MEDQKKKIEALLNARCGQCYGIDVVQFCLNSAEVLDMKGQTIKIAYKGLIGTWSLHPFGITCTFDCNYETQSVVLRTIDCQRPFWRNPAVIYQTFLDTYDFSAAFCFRRVNECDSHMCKELTNIVSEYAQESTWKMDLRKFRRTFEGKKKRWNLSV